MAAVLRMATGIRSAKVKLARAAKHIRALKRSIAKYSASKPHKIVAKTKTKKKLHIPRRPPQEISVLVGEAVYQMRSALDHLVFELIQRNPKVASIKPDWWEHCEFPLRTRAPKNGKAATKKDFSNVLPGIADVPFAFIEKVQPYQPPGTAITTAMRFLAHLSNIDKHRRFNLVRPRVQQFHSFVWPGGFIGKGTQALDHGAELESFAEWPKEERPMNVKRRYRAFVAFNETDYLGEATGLPIDFLLETILEQINTQIIPVFEEFLKKPKALLTVKSP
jgi:hypothetical protein